MLEALNDVQRLLGLEVPLSDVEFDFPTSDAVQQCSLLLVALNWLKYEPRHGEAPRARGLHESTRSAEEVLVARDGHGEAVFVPRYQSSSQAESTRATPLSYHQYTILTHAVQRLGQGERNRNALDLSPMWILWKPVELGTSRVSARVAGVTHHVEHRNVNTGSISIDYKYADEKEMSSRGKLCVIEKVFPFHFFHHSDHHG
jgi:hypothetical protein